MATVPLPTLHVIVPCHNERPTIRSLLERVAAVDFASIGVAPRLWIVDDGSTDGSGEAIDAFVESHPDLPAEKITLPVRSGKGAAVREALTRVDDGMVLIQDADLEYSPANYAALVRPILAGATRVVYGSRWIYTGRMRLSGWLYSAGGFLENLFLRTLYRTNISDIATGYKVFRAEVIKDLPLACEGFEFCPEVTALLLNRGETIIEVPIDYTPRTRNEGKKIRWTDFFVAIRTLWRIRRQKPAVRSSDR